MGCISDSCFLNDDQGSAQRETLTAELGSVCQVSSSRSVPAVETPDPLFTIFPEPLLPDNDWHFEPLVGRLLWPLRGPGGQAGVVAFPLCTS